MKNYNSSSKTFTSISVSLLISITFFVFGPLELYISNKEILWFKMADIFPIIIIIALISFILIFFICFKSKGKLNKILLPILFSLGFCIYIQGNFINFNYGILDGNKINLFENKLYGILNSIFWISVFLISIYISFKKDFIKFNKIISFISLIIVATQLVTITVLYINNKDENISSELILSEDEMFSISDKENIIVFIIDTLDAQFFERFLGENPEYKEVLKDFTYFKNAVSGAAPTRYGVPLMLTGKSFLDDRSYEEYKYEAYKESNLYDDLKKANYDIRFYTDKNVLSSSLMGKVDNLEFGSEKIKSYSGLMASMYKLTAFKYSPHFMKNIFWLYTGEFNNYKTSEINNLYVYGDDVNFFNDLMDKELSMSNKKIFRLYHLFGAHGPYSMDKNSNRVEEGSVTLYDQIQGSFNIISKYINFLKSKKVYDNTNIIIIADHGGVDLYQNPTVLVKTKKANQNLEINNSYVGFVDFRATVASFFMEDYSKYGMTFFDIKENEIREFSHYVDVVLAEKRTNKKYKTSLIEYLITGDPRIKENATELGEARLINKQVKEYKIGDAIKFDKFGNAFDYIYTGFSTQEDNGVWTEGNKAILKFDLSKNEIKKNVLLEMKFDNIFNGKQNAKIYANDILVAEKMLQNKTESFVIPKEYIINNKKLLELKFVLDDAISPESLNLSTDKRDLALFINNMEMSYTDKDVKDNYETYKLGDVVSFYKGGNAFKYLIYGFSSQEDKGTWTNGKRSKIIMSLPNNKLEDDLIVSIKLSGIFTGSQSVKVFANDNFIVEKTITNLIENIIIPKEHILNNSGLLTLEFILEDAVSPAELGVSSDTRELSLCFREMLIKIKE